MTALCSALTLAGCAAATNGSTTAHRDPLAATAASSSDAPAKARVRIAAAADLRFAMDQIVLQWHSANPDVAVEPVYGSSGTFFAQITEGAPFDVYFSADIAYPRELELKGLAESGTTQPYAIGQIVVWVPESSTIDVQASGLAALADPAVKTVAIANPEHAPYGRAAVAALKTVGEYDGVEPKLVLGENVSQAAQFVESGNADAGIIALSIALAPALEDKGRYAIVPIESYQRLEQGAVVLNAASDPAAARAFLDFVLGPEGRTVLDRYGFILPPS